MTTDPTRGTPVSVRPTTPTASDTIADAIVNARRQAFDLHDGIPPSHRPPSPPPFWEACPAEVAIVRARRQAAELHGGGAPPSVPPSPPSTLLPFRASRPVADASGERAAGAFVPRCLAAELASLVHPVATS